MRRDPRNAAGSHKKTLNKPRRRTAETGDNLGLHVKFAVGRFNHTCYILSSLKYLNKKGLTKEMRKHSEILAAGRGIHKVSGNVSVNSANHPVKNIQEVPTGAA